MTQLTASNYAHLRIFYSGLQLDHCIEPCNTFGRLFPSLPLGQLIKLGSLRDLKAKGLIKGEYIECLGVEYKRYSISELGKTIFEAHKNEHSK